LESIAERSGNTYRGQSPEPGDRGLRPGSLAALAADKPMLRVADVRVTGCRQASPAWVASLLRTRRGRYYNTVALDFDYHTLMRTGNFDNVRIFTRQTPAGVTVTFDVVESTVQGSAAQTALSRGLHHAASQPTGRTTTLKPTASRQADVYVYAPNVAP
jgi:hypothetical protein